jgi:hypothetical protein
MSSPIIETVCMEAPLDRGSHGTIHEVLDLLAVVPPEFAGSRRADHHDKPLLRIAEKLHAVGAVLGELTWAADAPPGSNCPGAPGAAICPACLDRASPTESSMLLSGLL